MDRPEGRNMMNPHDLVLAYEALRYLVRDEFGDGGPLHGIVDTFAWQANEAHVAAVERVERELEGWKREASL